jgi:hypothetical protein
MTVMVPPALRRFFRQWSASKCYERGTHMKTAAVEYGAATVIFNVYEW